MLMNTVAPHNSDTPNSDTNQNSDTLFALTKISLSPNCQIPQVQTP